MSEEEERLRRELRAMAAVNRQLQAQLDEPSSVTKHRRAGRADDWIDKLVTAGVSQPSLVRSAAGAVFVVEGKTKRAVKAGILAAAIEQALGTAREVTEAELAGWDDGVPVELLEAPDGTAFVIVGGKRHTARGVPLPFPVNNRQASEFPSGDDFNVAAANIPRSRYLEVTSPQYQMQRVKEAVRKKGVVGTGKAVARRVTRRLGRGSK
jgi:hypothetical protein